MRGARRLWRGGVAAALVRAERHGCSGDAAGAQLLAATPPLSPGSRWGAHKLHAGAAGGAREARSGPAEAALSTARGAGLLDARATAVPAAAWLTQQQRRRYSAQVALTEEEPVAPLREAAPASASASAAEVAASPADYGPLVRVLKTKLQCTEAETRKLELHGVGAWVNACGLCPSCGGGEKHERSFSVRIVDPSKANGVCWRQSKCGWSGNILSSGRAVRNRPGTAAAPTADAGLPAAAVGTSKRKAAAPSARTLRAAAAAAPAPAAELPAAEVAGIHDFSPDGAAVSATEREVLQWLTDRRISPATLRACRVGWKDAGKERGPAVCFRYYDGDRLVGVKFRAVRSKVFWQAKGSAQILYGINDVGGGGSSAAQQGPDAVVIVEGEMDKLALYEAGVPAAVSVPNGAPSAGSVPADGDGGTPTLDGKFAFLAAHAPLLDAQRSFVIATDSDAAGQACAAELARRLGKERCWRVLFPAAAAAAAASDKKQKKQPAAAPKDANDVLMAQGPEALLALMDGAQQWPILGLKTFDDYRSLIVEAYNAADDTQRRGLSTGWASVDELYRVVPGELTVVTGVPSSGKSEWIDALMMNLARSADWSFALCSLENSVEDHFRKLAEKYIGKPFALNAWYARGQPRMTEAELAAAHGWLARHFFLLRHEEDDLPDIEWVLDHARSAVRRHGVRGLVIDPYNELEHRRPRDKTETEYVSGMLSRVKRFAQMNGVHVWFVAHPKQMIDYRDEPPRLYDISGSAHWVNKADNGVVVHRYDGARLEGEGRGRDEVDVHVLKVRNKQAGRRGKAVLRYSVQDGTYADMKQPPAQAAVAGTAAKGAARGAKRAAAGA